MEVRLVGLSPGDVRGLGELRKEVKLVLNVEMEMEDDDTLVIRVDLSQRHGPSASGKTLIVASTQGNQPAPNDPAIRIGLNVYTYPS